MSRGGRGARRAGAASRGSAGGLRRAGPGLPARRGAARGRHPLLVLGLADVGAALPWPSPAAVSSALTPCSFLASTFAPHPPPRALRSRRRAPRGGAHQRDEIDVIIIITCRFPSEVRTTHRKIIARKRRVLCARRNAARARPPQLDVRPCWLSPWTERLRRGRAPRRFPFSSFLNRPNRHRHHVAIDLLVLAVVRRTGAGRSRSRSAASSSSAAPRPRTAARPPCARSTTASAGSPRSSWSTAP